MFLEEKIMKNLKNKKILIAVSGGSDSMYLLEKIPKNDDLTVAFVNYNQRKDSHIDEQIVTDYCLKKNIKLKKLILKSNDFKSGNFQEWARQKRYEFFQKIYIEENKDLLVTAHHKDDLIETYYLNKISGRKKINYGIKKQTNIFNMNVYRPLLHSIYKRKIEKICKKEKILFAVDSSNFSTKYSRNKIRKKMQKYPFFIKNIIFFWILFINKIKYFLYKKIEKEYKIWFEKDFEQNIFSNLKHKEKIVYMFITKNYKDINLTRKKIKSICSFIISKNRSAKYKLKDGVYLIKKQGKLR